MGAQWATGKAWDKFSSSWLHAESRTHEPDGTLHKRAQLRKITVSRKIDRSGTGRPVGLNASIALVSFLHAPQSVRLVTGHIVWSCW